jgi:hypothetical protein
VGGGPTLGLPGKGDPRVGVFLLQPRDVGVVVCGGKVGTKGCMCIVDANKCSVATHRVFKVDSDYLDSDRQIMVIKTPGKSGTLAYVKPVLATDSISTAVLEDFTKTTRSVQSWQTMFERVTRGQQRGDEQEVIEEGAKRSMNTARVEDAVTPRKKKLRFDLGSVPTPEEYEELTELY